MSIQYSTLLCITIKISNLEPGIQDKIIAISVQNIFGRFIAFLVPDSLHITSMLSLLRLVLLLLQTNPKKWERKWSVLSCYFYEDDPLNACSGTLMKVLILIEFSKLHKLFALKSQTSVRKILKFFLRLSYLLQIKLTAISFVHFQT